MKYLSGPLLAGTALLSVGAMADPCAITPTITIDNATKPASVASDPLKKAYFGEQHMHIMYSLDAYMGMGSNKITPDMAYRFAKGEAVAVPGGMARLHKPLDFAAITDHAEFFGESYASTDPDSGLYDKPMSVLIRNPTNSEFVSELVFVELVQRSTRAGVPSKLGQEAGCAGRNNTWQKIVDVTEAHNEPGVFTTLHAYEWSSAPNSANLHRNVIFRSAQGDQLPNVPFSALDSNKPEDLWAQLEIYSSETGLNSPVLAIPHNSNYSKGLMFPVTKLDGDPIDQDWVNARAKFERAIEMMQAKQNSEVSRIFSPLDEFADFETFDVINNSRLHHRSNWVREGLKDGLQKAQQFGGVNPYQLGFVGGTDNHNGLTSDVEEYDWKGAHGPEDASPAQRATGEVPGWAKTIYTNPGAITGVWAESNTRDDLWQSIHDRETFATSGTRIQVRFFGGWNFGDTVDIQTGYNNGVPMGGELDASDSAATTTGPKFMVMAISDPDSAYLDRIQIVKGWLDNAGNTQEKVYDVVWSDPENRQPDPNYRNRLPPITNSVDIAAASYAKVVDGKNVGEPELSTTWTDPDYDASQAAFYYARVLEAHTPRWSTYDAHDLGTAPPEGVPATIQERAWSSPIWIKPAQ